MNTIQNTITTANIVQSVFAGQPLATLNATGPRYCTIKAEGLNTTELYYGISRICNGLVSITSGINILTGVGTIFTQELTVGAVIITAGQTFTVQSITNDTTLIVTTNATATVANQPLKTGISSTYNSYRLDSGESSPSFIAQRLADILIVGATAGSRYYATATY
jgi:hypothetical protein